MPAINFAFGCLIYLAFMGMLEVAIFGLGCVTLVLIPPWQFTVYRKKVSRLFVFLFLFLLVGALFNGLWSCLIWGRLYDSTDYAFDFIPFFPIGKYVLDRPWGDARGHLYGISLFELQLIWLLFATATWAVTIFLYRYVWKLSRARLERKLTTVALKRC